VVYAVETARAIFRDERTLQDVMREIEREGV